MFVLVLALSSDVHLKEFTKKGTDYSLETFRPLLDGTTDWPAVIEAFDQTGYRGYLTFEYFHPYLCTTLKRWSTRRRIRLIACWDADSSLDRFSRDLWLKSPEFRVASQVV